jgi:hypothetical protein
MRRNKIKKWIEENIYKNTIHVCGQTIKFKFYNIYTDILSETSYFTTNNFMERLFHILNDIDEKHTCECGNGLSFLGIYKGYSKTCRKCMPKSRIGKTFLNYKNEKCSYGCGEIAKYKTKNGKICCSEIYSKCLVNRKKYGSSGIKNSMYGKSAVKYSIEDWKNKYKLLFELEEAKISDDNSEILICCKLCEKWFPSTYEKLRSRHNALLYGNKRHYFFCSKDCAEKSGLYKRKCEITNLTEYRNYRWTVFLRTEYTIRKFRDKIKDIEVRDRYHPIDHKYSIREAFDKNVPIEIVSHWKNLEITTLTKNSRKNKKCSITLDQLKKEIQEGENA